jgi:tRNA pseudouridine55 synthase
MDELKFSTIDQVKQQQKGLILVDKDQDWTSHDVVAKMRSLVGVKKIGHAGTLDPLATGLLIILVGREFTRLQDQFMKQDKEYEVEAQFGIETDSYDAMGKVINKVDWEKVNTLTQEKIEAVMKDLTGEIVQTVPAFSAVKVKGKKLYQKARKGKIDLATLPKRTVNIYKFKLAEFKKDQKNQQLLVKFTTKVSSGTYIRSLIHDLGKILQVGAHVTQLRRVSIGNINVDKAVKIA